MPKVERGERSRPHKPPAKRTPDKSADPEDRLEELRLKIARQNRETELIAEAMQQKPKKS